MAARGDRVIVSVVDAHVHAWDAGAVDHPWLTGAALPDVRLPRDVDRADGQVTRMVFVETDAAPGLALDEVRWVMTQDWPELAGIVAAADLRSPTLPEELAALRAAGPVVGVRHLLQDEAVVNWQPDLLAAGLRALGDQGLTFDACVRYRQLTALAYLLESAPQVPVVLDHLGKPPLADGFDSPAGRDWHRAIERLAQLPHVAVKLSGLAAETDDPAVFAGGSDAFLHAALDAFGPDRAMIGSDWPVSARAGQTTSDWIARVRRVAGEQAWPAVSAGTATSFYGLDAGAQGDDAARPPVTP